MSTIVIVALVVLGVLFLALVAGVGRVLIPTLGDLGYIFVRIVGSSWLPRVLADRPWVARVLLLLSSAAHGIGVAVLIDCSFLTALRAPMDLFRYSHWAVGFAVAIVLFVFGFIHRACRRAELRTTALGAGPIAVLFLRVFVADGLEQGDDTSLFFGLGARSQEEKLVSLFGQLGRVVALATPNDAPELGAERIAVNSNEWQQAIARLCEDARVILLRVGTSAGVTWEMEHVARNPHILRRTVFILPKVPRWPDYAEDLDITKRLAIDHAYAAFCTTTRGRVPLRFQLDRGEAGYVFFKANDEPQLLTGKADRGSTFAKFCEHAGIGRLRRPFAPLVLLQTAALGIMVFFIAAVILTWQFMSLATK